MWAALTGPPICVWLSARHRVVFEIVERQAVRELMHLRAIVNFYRHVGFRVALDDFGSGYSTVESYLALVPGFPKLDMSFAQEAAT